MATAAPPTNDQQIAEQWAAGFLNYIGAPAASSDDPRLKFLTAMEMHEGIVQKDPNNPVAIEAGGTTMQGSKVSTFPTTQAGYAAFHSYLLKNHITGLLQGLTSQASTVEGLTSELAAAHWEGSATPQATQASIAYANAVGNLASGGSLQPLTAPSATTTPASTSTTPTSTSTTNVGDLNYANTVGNPNLVNIKADYTGPNAYKGFDLSSIPAALKQQTINAIDAFTANPTTEKNILADITNHYGEMSWVASDPEILTVLVASSYNSWATKDPATYQSAIIATNWWKNSSDNSRLWQEAQANDPGQAQAALQQAGARVTNIANTLGVQLTQAQLDAISNQVCAQSVTSAGQFSNTAFTDQQIYLAVTGAVNQATITQQLTGAAPTPVGVGATSTPAASATPAVTAQGGGGDAASLYNQFSTISRNFYLNLTPQQIAAQVAKVLSGDTGDPNYITGQIQQFTTNAQNTAKIMYPGLASVLGTTSSAGTDATPYESMAWARNMIAQYTGLGSGDNVDLSNPQWSWILSGKPAPTNVAAGISQQSSTTQPSSSNATPAIPSADELQTYLMQTPQYQTTNMAKDQAWQIGSSLVKAFGYN